MTVLNIDNIYKDKAIVILYVDQPAWTINKLMFFTFNLLSLKPFPKFKPMLSLNDRGMYAIIILNVPNIKVE